MPHLAGICDPSGKSSIVDACDKLERLLDVRGTTFVPLRWTNDAFGAINMVLPAAAGRSTPVRGDNGDNVLLLDGAVFNEKALFPLVVANDLEPFKDSAALCLRLFEKYGPTFVERLNGQFNIVIYNTRTHRVLLMNDRTGYRPLYYSTANRRLAFACEQKAILAVNGAARALDRLGILQLFAFGHHLGDRTVFENVTALPQAAIAEYDPGAGELRIEQYWRPQYTSPPGRVGLAGYADEYGRRMCAAVAARVEGCRKPGLFLSGGLDCRAVAGTLFESGREFSTFTFDLSESDVTFGRQIAAACGCDHHAIAYADDVYGSGLSRIVWRTEGAVPFSHNTSIEIHKAIAPHVDWVFNGHFGNAYTRTVSYHFLPIRNRAAVLSYIMNKWTYLQLPGLERLFRRDFLQREYPEMREGVEDSLVALEERRPWLLFNLWWGTVRERRFTFSSPAIDRYVFDQLTPFVDNDVMDWGLQIPQKFLFLERGFKSMVVRTFPQIRNVPWAVTGKKIPSTFWSQFVNETWLAGIAVKRKLKKRISRRVPRARSSQLDGRLRIAIERYCESDAFCDDVLDVKKVRDVVTRHFEGQAVHWKEVEVLATLAEASRLFIEQEFCAPPDDVQPRQYSLVSA